MIDCHPRSKNGQPAHNTTGVASMSWNQFDALIGITSRTDGPMTRSAIARANTGNPTITLTQNRLVISVNSGLGPSSTCAIRGSSAMPQIGQGPGRSLSTSGSMGQMYSTLGPGGATDGVVGCGRGAIRDGPIVTSWDFCGAR
jgi:hypothetical protein